VPSAVLIKNGGNGADIESARTGWRWLMVDGK